MRRAILGVAGLVAGTGAVWACTCLPPARTAAVELLKSDAVFVGEVLSKRDSSEHEDGGWTSVGSIVGLHVLRCWKGAHRAT